MHGLNDLNTCKNRLFGILKYQNCYLSNPPQPCVKHILKILVKICATLKIASALQYSNGTLGIGLSLDCLWKLGGRTFRLLKGYGGPALCRQRSTSAPGDFTSPKHRKAQELDCFIWRKEPTSFSMRIYLNSEGVIIKYRSQYWNLYSLSSAL